MRECQSLLLDPRMIFDTILSVFFFPSVGQPKHTRVMAGGLEGEFFFGSKAEVGL